MTQEEIQLLLKDLCARLSYGVICRWEDDGFSNIGELTDICHQETNEGFRYWDGFLNFGGEDIPIELIKPYLRSMSNMTEEEKKVVCSMNMISDTELNDRLNYQRMYIQNYTIETFDYFNERKLDYRGLIEKGLAIEASEDTYK